MQNSYSTYQNAAWEGVPKENDWAEPELSLQPHALDMHGVAGGARSAPPGVYPGGSARSDTQWEQDAHTPVHFSDVAPQYRGVIGFYDNVNQPDNFAYDPYMCGLPTMRRLTAPGAAPTSFGIQDPAFPSTEMSYNSNVAAHNIGAMGYDPFALVKPGTTPHNIDAIVNDFYSLPAGIADPPLPPTANGRFTCSICSKTYARRGDLRRHELKHNPTMRKFDCPKSDCVRKGAKGFERKDKMVDHLKVCKGGARGKYRG